MKFKIISDSTCDLSEELIQKNNIAIVPLIVSEIAKWIRRARSKSTV